MTGDAGEKCTEAFLLSFEIVSKGETSGDDWDLSSFNGSERALDDFSFNTISSALSLEPA